MCVKGAHTTGISEVVACGCVVVVFGVTRISFVFVTSFSIFGSWLAKVRTANKVGSSGLLDFHMVAELVFLGRLLCVR